MAEISTVSEGGPDRTLEPVPSPSPLVAGLAPLRIWRAAVVLRAEQAGSLPPFLGSTLRGALASQTRAAACTLHRSDCEACPERHRCPYHVLFETAPPPDAERLRNMADVPRPLVLEPPPVNWADRPRTEVRPGTLLGFGIVLVGQGLNHWPMLLHGLERMGPAGLGREALRFRLHEVRVELGPTAGTWLYRRGQTDRLRPEQAVTQADLPPVWTPTARRITLELHMPTRLVEQHSLRRHPTFRTVVRSLLGRLSSLLYFHEQRPLDIDFGRLLAVAAQATTEQDTTWLVTVDRWSNRQRRSVPLDGLVGRLGYAGPGLELFEPLFRLGQLVHVGKDAIFGCGRFTAREE